MNKCECKEPGWCQRHLVNKNECLFQLCKNNSRYWEAWENNKGPRQINGARGHVTVNVNPNKIVEFFPTLAAPWLNGEDLMRCSFLLLQKLIPYNISKVVGIPRSGMIVASFLATHLNTPLYTLYDNEIIPVQTGLRWNSVENFDDSGLTLIVEDSSASGFSINKFKRKFGTDNIKYVAAIASPNSIRYLDYYGEILRLPHWFSWNFFGNKSIMIPYRVTTDMDGLLCEDCTQEQDDDGEKYIDWMQSVKPILRNIFPFTAIITARLEKYREITEEWLNTNNILYDKLIMYPSNSLPRGDIVAWKKEKIKECKSMIYLESDPVLARHISINLSTAILCPPAKCGFFNGSRHDEM